MVSLVFLVFATIACAVGVMALADSHDVRALYWLFVGATCACLATRTTRLGSAQR